MRASIPRGVMATKLRKKTPRRKRSHPSLVAVQVPMEADLTGKTRQSS